MCCLFGFHDYGHKLTRKQRSVLLSALSVASEDRGTDATGIAYNVGGRLQVYKRPLPAHLMWYRVPLDAAVVMGHTRMTTQGAESRNYNNHPFHGHTDTTDFALAHNGVLHNDKRLRKQLDLPGTIVETDSYIAVQIIEAARELRFSSLRYMAEKLEGSFTITVLSEKDELYFVKGDNPMCIYHYPEKGIYLYASTEDILKKALKKIPFRLGKSVRIDLYSGQLMCIDANGNISRSSFDDSKLYNFWGYPSRHLYTGTSVFGEDEYLDDLKSVAMYYGLYPEDIDKLLTDGYTVEDIEELLYCG